MKVLIVFYGDDYIGGTTYSTLSIAEGLANRGHEVHAYVHVTKEGILKRDLEDRGVIVHDGNAPLLFRPLTEKRIIHKLGQDLIGEIRRIYSYPKSEREVEQIVRSCDIDLIAICGAPLMTGVAAAQRTNTPLAWHIREFMQEDHGFKYFDWVDPYAHMSQADCLICVSQAVEKKMNRVCPGTPTKVVYNGIDQKIFYPNEQNDRPSDGPVRIMFSGGVRHSKGTFLVLDALAKIGSAIPYSLDIYGFEGGGIGENAKELSKRCEEMGLQDRVTYHGPVNDIANQYRNHDILIVASRQEAFGRVTAESMLCGCAVVGSNSGGTPELLADGRGYLFEPNDAESLVQALLEAAKSPKEREERVSKALRYAREVFSVNTYVDQIEDVYLSLVS